MPAASMVSVDQHSHACCNGERGGPRGGTCAGSRIVAQVETAASQSVPRAIHYTRDAPKCAQTHFTTAAAGLRLSGHIPRLSGRSSAHPGSIQQNICTCEGRPHGLLAQGGPLSSEVERAAAIRL